MLIKKKREKKINILVSGQIESELSALYPGVDIKKQLQQYYCEKISLGIKLAVLGLVIALAFVCKQMMNGDLKDDKYVEREANGGGEREVVLDAVIGDERIEDVVITIGEQELSASEKQARMKEVCEALPEIIKGENSSLDSVSMPLNLIAEWEDSGITIFWSSSDYGILKEDGSFGEEKIPKQGAKVTLTAEIFLDGLQRKEEMAVTVYPQEKTGRELIKEQLTEAVLQKEKDTRVRAVLELPDTLHGRKIIWTEKKNVAWICLIGFPAFAVFMVLWAKDQEIHTQYKERNRRLLLEYSEFVSKLSLLIGSGMSCRNAFIRLATDYEKRKERGGKKQIVYEEVMMMVRKLENGMSEQEAYDYFSRRCSLTCYKKLVSIVIRNQKKGTDGLMESLSVETKNAFEERKQEAKRLGEEAGTKLLVPMMMMMGIVMMIIVIPAYFSFGGI